MFRLTALAGGSLTYVGMIQDLHYSDFSEELKSTESEIVHIQFFLHFKSVCVSKGGLINIKKINIRF